MNETESMPHGVTVKEVSHDFWTVIFDGQEIGTVVGGGPTRDTRFKSIRPSQAAVNPDYAPGGYSRTLRGAVESLVRNGS